MVLKKTSNDYWIEINSINYLIETFDFHSHINSHERAELYLWNIPQLREVVERLMNEKNEVEKHLLVAENRNLLNVSENEMKNWELPFKERSKMKEKKLLNSFKIWGD